MRDILQKVNSPEDIKNLSLKELNMLCKQIREYVINSVCITGGHLASNLGVVELTVVLHYVFNSPIDKMIWDVGHQTYIHKILTGRKSRLNTLRQIDGLSGFPKRSESEHDIFNTGHSSTSISAGLGIARSRDIKKEDYHVISIIGDGALTGGMAFEALNDAGRSDNNFIVILNDNEMSIDRNVGGLSKYLNRIRTRPIYYKAKEDVEFILNRIPLGKGMAKTINKAKDGIKCMLLAGMFFEELGFKYFGPVDGHDVESMIDVLSRAKDIDGPVLIHVLTLKGKGYEHAEKKPNTYHGISKFDKETGIPVKTNINKTFSQVFGKKLCELAKNDDKIVAVSAAMVNGTGLDNFTKEFPDRMFDVGIAEQHAVTFAGGLAVNNMKPVVALYSSFMQRAYDQIIHDIAMQNLHVVFAIDRAGLVGEDGETHQGVYDVSFLNHMPNMTIMAPADTVELQSMLEYALEKHKGPIALRYPRGCECTKFKTSTEEIEYGKGLVIKEGADITLAASGRMVYSALMSAEMLEKYNYNAEVLNLRFLKPFDKNLIIKSVIKTGKLIILEEGTVIGSTASMIKNVLFDTSDSSYDNIKVHIKALPDEFITHGSVDKLFKRYNMDSEGITKIALNMLSIESGKVLNE